MTGIIKSPFKEQDTMQALVRVLSNMVGEYMGKLVTPKGKETEYPAIYLTSQDKFPQATLPLLQVGFEQINDEDGRLLDKGLLKVVDPFTEGSFLYFPYTSTHMYYTVQLTCQGKGSHDILEKVRGLLRFDTWREQIHTELKSGIFMQSRIIRNPQMISTEWRDQHTMLMTFSTVSTHVDYSGSWFNIIEMNGVWKHLDETDADPIDNPPKYISEDETLYTDGQFESQGDGSWVFKNSLVK